MFSHWEKVSVLFCFCRIICGHSAVTRGGMDALRHDVVTHPRREQKNRCALLAIMVNHSANNA